jgi:hypothetical protein
LLDAPRYSVSVQWTQSVQSLQHHQIEGAIWDFRSVVHQQE